MPAPISVQSTRAGLCPHGLPPSACPICNGGGGGGGRVREAVASKPTISTEWSFMKCYAAGLALKVQDARVENAKTTLEQQLQFAKELNKNIQNIADKIQTAIQNIQNISPQFVQNIIQVLNNTILTPLMHLVAQLPKLIEKMVDLQQRLGTMLQQAGEKLTAILGEIKNFIEKKIVEDIKKEIKKLLFFFMPNLEDENYNGDDKLEVFKAREMKKYLVNLVTKIKKRNDDENRSDKE